MRAFLTTLLCTSRVHAAGWNYLENGADWDGDCDGDTNTNQTPINLVTPGHDDFDYPLIKDVKDERHYNDQLNVEITWNGHTSQTSTLETGSSFFVSDLAREHFGATEGPITWDAQ